MTLIESLLSQLREAASTADLSVRSELSDQLQCLARSIATPRQTMQHYGHTYTEQAVAKIAADLKIFSILAQSESSLKTEDIADKTGVDPALIDRMLRHLASTYLIVEVGQSTFAANDTTKVLASPAGEGNIVFGFDTLNKAFQELPNFLRDKKYKNPDQVLDTAFHRAYNTKMQFFLWFQQHPEQIKHFHPSLTAFESPVSWTSIAPLTEMLQGADQYAPLFVDIGDGHGYQCAAFRKATAEQFPGRVINQDLPETLATAPRYEDIEMMSQDFYQKQQVQGNAFTIFPDSDAKRILQHTRDAMSPHSFLLIDELVIPETGASRFSMQLDITVMAFFGSTERTEQHWRRLLAEVGLEIIEVHRYDPSLEYSILQVVPTSS